MKCKKQFLLNKIAVSLLVRLWVEILSFRDLSDQARVSLLVRLWVEIPVRNAGRNTQCWSASLWGCELKWKNTKVLTLTYTSASLWGCELKSISRLPVNAYNRQPPCEAVSWNDKTNSAKGGALRQPPCEAVSWNVMESAFLYSSIIVSLLVRLWVEMRHGPMKWETDHRQPPCEAVSWNNVFPSAVAFCCGQPPCEAVSWNDYSCNAGSLYPCQPPCEAVSWNKNIPSDICAWLRQPPCEAVSWNKSCRSPYPGRRGQPPCEAVSWNMCIDIYWVKETAVSLLVRLWVEIQLWF